MNSLENASADEKVILGGIITSDSVVDQSWGSMAYEGYLKIIDNYPIEIDFFSEISTEEEMEETMAELITKEASIIIGHGEEFSDIFTQYAQVYPTIHFVTINGEAIYPNQTSYTFHRASLGYFAGVLSALMTESSKIGVINAYGPEGRGLEGFIEALEVFNPEAELFQRIVGSRDDEELGASIAKELIDEGVDVIFTRGNAYNRAVIHEVEKADIYAIGFLTDQAYMAENHVLTSMINDTSETYRIIMEHFFDEEGMPSGNLVLDFKDGVYAFTSFGEMVPQEVQDIMHEELRKYNLGEFSFDE